MFTSTSVRSESTQFKLKYMFIFSCTICKADGAVFMVIKFTASPFFPYSDRCGNTLFAISIEKNIGKSFSKSG